MPLSIVISYCSNEACFLEPLLRECLKCSDDIVVSYGTHLYNGVEEDLEMLRHCQDIFETAVTSKRLRFVSYNVGPEYYDGFGVVNRPTAYWHNVARWTGIQALHGKEWVLLIDADEIPEGDVFDEWFQYMEENNVLKPEETYKIANYWYFKKPTYRAHVLEDSVLLIHHSHLTKENVFQDWERDGLIAMSKTKLLRQTKSLDDEVMAHHFSWTRSREGLTHKIMNWGHANEYDDPSAIIEKVFSSDDVNDVIKHYTYDKVENLFNIEL